MAYSDFQIVSDASTNIGSIAYDPVGTHRVPLSKILIGVSGSDGGLLSVSNGMPVSANTAADGSGTEKRLLVDSDGALLVSASGEVSIGNWPETQPVSAASLPLPTGAATSANQTTANTSLDSIDGKITDCNTGAVVVSSSALPTGAATAAKQPALGTAGTAATDVITVQGISGGVTLTVDGSGVTQPVSAESLPLPTGASTSAKQDTGNTSLASIDGKITACDTGSVIVSSSALPTGASTSAKQPALGTAGTAASDVLTVQGIASMVALKVDGSGVTQPVSGTVTANSGTNLNTSALALESGGNLAALAGTDFATETTLSALNGKVTACDTGSVVVSSSALPTGASTAANQTTGNTSLSSIDGKITACNTGAVVVSSSALPTGGTTEATLKKLVGLGIAEWDYASLTYTSGQLTGVVYKTGGSSGTTVSTLALAYSGSQLSSITRT